VILVIIGAFFLVNLTLAILKVKFTEADSESKLKKNNPIILKENSDSDSDSEVETDK